MITVTPRPFRKSVRRSQSRGHRRWLAFGRAGWGCSGLSYQFKYDPKPRGQDKRVHLRATTSRYTWIPKAWCFSRHDSRLEGFSLSIRFRVREPAREEKLRVRNIVHRVMSAVSLSAGLLQLFRDSSKAVGGYRRPAKPVLFVKPEVPSGPLRRGTVADQQHALDATALLNDAYRVLRDPIQRAEYLLRRKDSISASSDRKMFRRNCSKKCSN